jgi:hypothetical protein
MNNAFYVEGSLGLPGKIQFELIHLDPIAIGTIQSPTGQSDCAIAIGKYAGLYNQGECAIAIGESAGQNSQGMMGIAIGAGAGDDSQAELAIALGVDAGSTNQATSAVAIGTEAGMNNQSQNAIAMGTHAGRVNQDEYTIALGAYAGQTNQHARTIVLNAMGAPLNTLGTDRTYLAPVRTEPGDSLVQYNSTNYEITTSNTLNFDLTVNGYVTSWADYTSPPPFPENSVDTTTITGVPGGASKYSGGVLAPNGKIYFIPNGATNVGILDPLTNTLDTTTITGTPIGYKGGVLAPNGKIYGIPNATTSVLVIDPSTDSFSTISGVPVGSDYFGGVLGIDGKIYCIPFSASAVMVIDPVTNTLNFTFIRGLSTGGVKWAGGALAPNGKIYCIPSNETRVMIIDPSSPVSAVPGVTPATANYTNATRVLNCPGATFATVGSGQLLVGDNLLITTTTTSYMGYVQSITDNQNVVLIYALGVDIPAGQITGIQKTRRADLTTISGLAATGFKYWGGAVAPNGKIYCTPSFGGLNNVLVINTLTNTTTTIALGQSGYTGAVLGRNNKIYLIPFDTPVSLVRVIDPTTDTVVASISGLPTGLYKSEGGVLAPNGQIYCPPFQISFVPIINTQLPSLPDWPLQAYFNKL